MNDAATVTIGGITALSVQMTVMAMIRRVTVIGGSADRWFDWLNWPVAFVLMLVANPPWPYWSVSEWQAYIGLSLALATLASVTAKKTSDAKPRESEGDE